MGVIRDTNVLSILHYQHTHTGMKEEEPRFKADTSTFPTVFRCQKPLIRQPLLILFVDKLYTILL